IPFSIHDVNQGAHAGYALKRLFNLVDACRPAIARLVRTLPVADRRAFLPCALLRTTGPGLTVQQAQRLAVRSPKPQRDVSEEPSLVVVGPAKMSSRFAAEAELRRVVDREDCPLTDGPVPGLGEMRFQNHLRLDSRIRKEAVGTFKRRRRTARAREPYRRHCSKRVGEGAESAIQPDVT